MSIDNQEAYASSSQRVLSEHEKKQQLPSDAVSVLSELSAGQLNEKAKQHLRAYSLFVMWATPFFDLGHVKIHKKVIEFDLMIAKRFLLSKNAQGEPRIEIQPSEFMWMRAIPWVNVGVHFKSKRIFLMARPERPLSSSFFCIPVDLEEKLDIFRKQRYVELRQSQIFSGPNLSDSFRLELVEIGDGFFTKRKKKHKL